MANSYYGRTFNFSSGTTARGTEVKSEYDALASAFDIVETDVKRAITMPAGTTVELPAIPADRSLMVIGFDINGDVEVQAGIGSFKGDWAGATDYGVRDIIVDAAGEISLDSVFISNSTHTSSGSFLADAANWDMMIDVTAVKLSELNAAASAAAALVSEGLADADATQTAADLVQTNLDQISCDADAIQVAADLVQTNLDQIQTTSDAADTAADLVQTNLDQIQTSLDAASTAADVVTTNADVVTTNADVVLTSADAVLATNHIADITDAHDASAISNIPAGTITATDQQAVNNELDTNKEPADATILKDADVGTGPNQLVQLDGSAKIPVAVLSRYASPEVAIVSSGSASLAHGLGAKPFMAQCVLVCKVAVYGYSIGDEVLAQNSSTDGNFPIGLSVVIDATNIDIRFGSNAQAMYVTNKTTGATQSIVNSDWKLILRAIL